MDGSAEFRTKDNRPAPMLKYSKKVNGTYYVVEAVPESKYKKFWVVSAYMEKADGGTQAPNANSPGNTPNTSLASSQSAFSPTVPQLPKSVNQNPSTTPAMQAFHDVLDQAEQRKAQDEETLPLPKGTGAMENDPNSYSAHQMKFTESGFFPEGPNSVRSLDTPQS